MAGFEPANVGVKGRCLTAWRHPHKRSPRCVASRFPSNHWEGNTETIVIRGLRFAGALNPLPTLHANRVLTPLRLRNYYITNWFIMQAIYFFPQQSIDEYKISKIEFIYIMNSILHLIDDICILSSMLCWHYVFYDKILQDKKGCRLGAFLNISNVWQTFLS